MDGDPRDFGKALRARVEQTAVGVARAMVAEQFEALGTEIRKAGEQAAVEAARRHVQSLKADLRADVRFNERVLEQIDKRLSDVGATLALVAPDHVAALQAEIAGDVARLRKQRHDMAKDLEAIRRADDELRSIAKALEDRAERVDHVAQEIGKRIVTLTEEIQKRADGSARMAVADLTSEALGRLAEIGKSMEARIDLLGEHVVAKADASVREAVAQSVAPVEKAKGELTSLRKAIEAEIDAWAQTRSDLIRKFEDEAAALQTDLVKAADHVIDPTADSAPLLPRAFRGPYADGVSYQRGDLAMFLGSTWIAYRKTSERPKVDPDDGRAWGLFAAGGFGGNLSGAARPKPRASRP